MEVWHEGNYTGPGEDSTTFDILKSYAENQEISKKKKQIANKAMYFE